jgi:undecaprenyl diphosphate synthase
MPPAEEDDIRGGLANADGSHLSIRDSQHRPPHVAIIMDGNGRWATALGLPRVAGHREGVNAVRRTVEAAAALSIPYLTLYAFSADNWDRPATEVQALLRLFEDYLRGEVTNCLDEQVRVSVIGRRDRLPTGLASAIEQIENATRAGARLHVRLAIDYSAREAIWLAAQAVVRSGERRSRAAFNRAIRSGRGEPAAVPDVDLLIRTGGEQRLSDFLLWECAYAELWFTQTMWPEFGEAELRRALDAYAARERRFGRVSSLVP